ncbi:hypothetical protein OS493_016128 [Desmophyllum pertusum]|uniref:SAP domain-containing protein n=1 Tax=Desmophyllum pertusum TaxID=174260 RepID=A0A9X0A2L9_9CNID|nr:hypothetical protein OS493_016128 [Desmophyllum pertusum]
MAEVGAVFSLKKLKPELKKELQDRGLPIKGNKSDLQARLEKCLSEQGVVVSQDESEEIADEHDAEDEHEDDLENDDADDLDDVDVGEDVSEHLGTEDLDIQTKEKEIIQDIVEDEKEKEKETTVSPVKRVPITPPGKVAGEVTVNDEQKKLQRSERFGQSPPTTNTDKKQARAQRFGFSSPASNGTAKSSPIVGGKDVDVDKLKKELKGFGAVSPAMTKIEESDRLLKRKQRFGVAVTAPATGDISEMTNMIIMCGYIAQNAS